MNVCALESGSTFEGIVKLNVCPICSQYGACRGPIESSSRHTTHRRKREERKAAV